MKTSVSIMAMLAIALTGSPAFGQEEKSDRRVKKVQKSDSNSSQNQSQSSVSVSSTSQNGDAEVEVIVNGEKIKVPKPANGAAVSVVRADGDGNVEVRVNGKKVDVQNVRPGNGPRGPVVKVGKPGKIPFLGISTRPVDESLRRHLDLPEGFGLQIEVIVEDSPAGKAGLREHDILVELEDQKLTTPDHLALLVRAKKPGDKVKLTVVRKGEEDEIEVTLGEREVMEHEDRRVIVGRPANPQNRGGQPVPGPNFFHGQMPPMPMPGPNMNQDEWQRALQQYQDNWQKWLEEQMPELRKQGKQPPAVVPKGNLKKARPAPTDSKPGEKRDVRGDNKPGGGKPPAIAVRPGFPIQVFGTSGIVKIDNGFGEVTIEQTEGKHSICIKDENGKVVHEGVYDPEAGTKGLPEKAREQLKEMKLDDLRVLTPGAGIMKWIEDGAEGRPSDPKPGKEDVKTIDDPKPKLPKRDSKTDSPA
ncbi:MAG: PDZ domain-containing protein [Verrucomicrobiales bacterium]|nr:PDZ domain-containing protein [Verrucomicrobiales bacterium]